MRVSQLTLGTAYDSSTHQTNNRNRSSESYTGEQSLAKVLDNYLKSNKAEESYDPITMFFLSTTQTVKIFPLEIQLEVKNFFLEIVSDAVSALLRNYQPSTPHFSSHG